MKAKWLLAGALLSGLPVVSSAQKPEEPVPVAPPAPDVKPAAPAPRAPLPPVEPVPSLVQVTPDDGRLQQELDVQLKQLNALQVQMQEKGPFLGVSTSPAGPALQKQLKLPTGMGLVVDFVEDNSPAKSAGLAQFDVLRKVNDQLLVNPEQLQVLIRSFSPGDEVKLTVLREGKSKELVAKLVEREVGVLWQNGDPRQRPFTFIAPHPDVKFGWGADPFRGKAQIVFAQPNGAETVNWDDDEHHLELRRPAKGEPTLTITRHGGKGEVLFQGPVRNEKDLNKLPPNLRKKFEMLESKLDRLELDPEGKASKKSQDMVVSRRDGERRLQLRDADGNTTFDAPIETPAQREALPPEIRKQLLDFSRENEEDAKPKAAPAPRR